MKKDSVSYILRLINFIEDLGIDVYGCYPEIEDLSSRMRSLLSTHEKYCKETDDA